MADLQTVVTGGYTYVSGRLYLTDSTGNRLAELTSETLEGKVQANVHNDIKLSLQVSGLNLSSIVPYASYVQPTVVLGDAYGARTEYPLGLYVTTPADKSHEQQYSTSKLEARSLEWILANSYPTAPYSVAVGDNPITKAGAILTQHGLRYTLPPTTLTFAVAKTWDVDSSYLTIVNDLLNAAAYYTIYPELTGYLTSQPYFELATAQPSLSLYSGEGSIVVNTVTQQGVYDSVANKVTVYKENSGGAAIRVTRTNNDPASAVSTVNLLDANGNPRIIHRVFKDSNIVSVNEAKALAKRLIEEGATYTNQLRVETIISPQRALHEVYDLAIYNASGAAIGYGLWWCDGWEIGFSPKDASMSHNLKRLEPYGWDEEIG